MTADSMENYERYCSLGKGFKDAFELLKSLDSSAVEGSFEKNGISYCIVQKTPEECENTRLVFEEHRQCAEIHCVVSGFEHFGFKNAKYLKEFTNYSKNEDCCFYLGDPIKLPLDEGDFCIMFPGDAHIPDMGCTDEGVKRAVVKVKLEQNSK